MQLHCYRPGDRDLIKEVQLQERSLDGSTLVFAGIRKKNLVRVEASESRNLLLPGQSPLRVKVFADSNVPYEGWWRKMADGVFDVVLIG